MIERLEQGGVAESGEVWTFIDMEHQPSGRLAGAPQALRRVRREAQAERAAPEHADHPHPALDGFEAPQWFVKQVLDSGALGIVFPQIDTKEQALRAIQSVRYPPQRGTKYPTPHGIRGYGPGNIKPLWGGIDNAEYSVAPTCGRSTPRASCS